jgi:glycosyltransferase involved in cell wall biosynthesis
MEFSLGLISVIIPTYNRAAIITDALDSVWDQTYRPIEVIVVDDGSVDNTQEVIAAWQYRHKAPDFEVRYFSRAHRGVASAKNLGLQEARGEYIQFLDSDDLIISDKLATQKAALKRDSVDYIYGVSAIIGQKGKIKLSVRFGRIGLKAEALHCLQESGNLWSRYLIWTHKFIIKAAHALSAQGVAFLSRLLSIALRISRHNYFP